MGQWGGDEQWDMNRSESPFKSIRLVVIPTVSPPIPVKGWVVHHDILRGGILNIHGLGAILVGFCPDHWWSSCSENNKAVGFQVIEYRGACIANLLSVSCPSANKFFGDINFTSCPIKVKLTSITGRF